MSFYPTLTGSAGTLSVTSGNTAVTGSGTLFASNVRSGDALYSNTTFMGFVATVNSNTSITLRTAAPSTLSSVTTWYFVHTSRDWNTTGATNDLLAKLLEQWRAGIGITPGASGTFAQRAAYNSAAQGFTYLRTDVTPFELYAKASATSGDWVGPTTLQGALGPTGAAGPTGPTGATGAAGALWYTTTSGAPSSGTGVNGDMAIALSTGVVYQKTGGSWVSTGQSLKGPQGDPGPAGADGAAGAAGATGADGRSLLNGTTNPTSGVGANGDFYINTTTLTLFGPKASGTWPAGISLLQLPPVVTINANTSSVALNMAIAQHFIINLSANVTSVTISNWPASGQLAKCTVEIRNTGSFTFAHPSGVKWANGYVPSNSLGNGKIDWFSYVSGDGGTTRTGFILGQDFT
jgi:hypothetical protein